MKLISETVEDVEYITEEKNGEKQLPHPADCMDRAKENTPPFQNLLIKV